MIKYTVNRYKYGYGIYEDGELLIIVFYKYIALKICELLNEDQCMNYKLFFK